MCLSLGVAGVLQPKSFFLGSILVALLAPWQKVMIMMMMIMVNIAVYILDDINLEGSVRSPIFEGNQVKKISIDF